MECLRHTQGDITTLAGVYTFSFLGVMTLFSVGTILLKFKRPSLPREVTVSYGTTLVGITCVSTGGYPGRYDVVHDAGLYSCCRCGCWC